MNFTIWIDGDACPIPVKDIVYRTANRLQIATVVVANAAMWLPQSEWLSLVIVSHGANEADDRIVADLNPGDIVITGDIPLAARVVEAGGLAIGTRGELYDGDRIQDRLATRNLMEQMRAAGMETGGAKPLNPKDVNAFANQFDRIVTKRMRMK